MDSSFIDIISFFDTHINNGNAPFRLDGREVCVTRKDDTFLIYNRFLVSGREGFHNINNSLPLHRIDISDINEWKMGGHEIEPLTDDEGRAFYKRGMIALLSDIESSFSDILPDDDNFWENNREDVNGIYNAIKELRDKIINL